MTDLVAAYIAREWIPKLVKRLARISGERREKLDQISLDFPDPEELARYYVEPDCQRVNPANLPDGEKDEYRKPVFKTIDHFLKAPSIDRSGANHRIVLGDAGMGKSSLLVMLWQMHFFGFWPKDIECTLLKLGPDTLEKIAEISVPGRHILLLDALDEDPSFSPETGGAKARLVELITASTRFRKVIISCRTQFFVDEDNDPAFAKLGTVRLEGFTCPISYLSPFDDPQAKELLEKRFPNTWRRLLFRPNEAREKAMSIAKVMGSLTMRPLLLSYIPFLLGDDLKAVSPLSLEGADREYEVYRLMITRWLDREVLKIKERDTAAIVPRSEELRKICWQVATLMELDGLRKMPETFFDDLKARLGAPEFLADNTLEGRTLLNKDSAGNFRFAHYSIQEFLIVEHSLDRGPFVRDTYSKCKVEPTELAQRFYAQRLRANLRSLILKSKSACSSDFEQMVTRAALAPGSLLYLAKMMAESTTKNDRCGDPGLVYLEERDWANDIRKIVVAVLLFTVAQLGTLDSWGNLDRAELNIFANLDGWNVWGIFSDWEHFISLQNLGAMDIATASVILDFWAKLDKVARMSELDSDIARLAKLDNLARWDNLNLNRLVSLHNFFKWDKLGKVDKLHKLAKWANSRNLVESVDGGWDKRRNLDKWRNLDNLINLDRWDVSGVLERVNASAVANIATQLAAGSLNLGFPEVYLTQICLSEIRTTWPTH